MDRRRRLLSLNNIGSKRGQFLVFSTQPVGAASGSTMATQPVVTAKNANGTTNTGFTGNVTVALTGLTGSPSLTGTATVAAVAGVATFSGLGTTGGASTWFLTATATAYQSATSATGTTTGGGVTTYASDAFTRADNASSLGTADVGGAWTAALGGTFGITSNQAGSSVNGGIVYLDAGVADGVLRCTLPNCTSQPGVLFRYANSTNLCRWVFSGGSMYLAKFIAGVTTNVSIDTVPAPLLSGGALVANAQLVLTMSGSTISGSINGTTIFSGATIGDAAVLTATKHGLYCFDTVGTQLWDDYSFKSA